MWTLGHTVTIKRSLPGEGTGLAMRQKIGWCSEEQALGESSKYNSHPVYLQRTNDSRSNGTTVFQPQSPVEQAFAREAIAYWLSFVRSGNPNTFKLPQSPIWTTYNAGSRLRVVLQQDPANTTIISGSRIEEEPEKETYRCGIVASKANDQQN